jgi:hypothetical protein
MSEAVSPPIFARLFHWLRRREEMAGQRGIAGARSKACAAGSSSSAEAPLRQVERAFLGAHRASGGAA